MENRFGGGGLAGSEKAWVLGWDGMGFPCFGGGGGESTVSSVSSGDGGGSTWVNRAMEIDLDLD